jgi:hypothetical protein
MPPFREFHAFDQLASSRPRLLLPPQIHVWKKARQKKPVEGKLDLRDNGVAY